MRCSPIRVAALALALVAVAPAGGAHTARRAPGDDVSRRLGGVEASLAAYYGTDASHERVRAVLAWLATNRARLASAYAADARRAKVPEVPASARDRLLAFWLGVRFGAERFRVAETLRYPPIVEARKPSDRREALASYDGSKHVFRIGRRLLASEVGVDAKLALVRAFDVGLHEGAHAHRYVNGIEPYLSVTELGVYVVQTRLALPVRLGDVGRAESYRYGCRDFNRLVESFRTRMAGNDRAADPDYLEVEYLGFVLGPWLRPDPDAALALVPSRSGDEGDWTVQDVITNAALARDLAAHPDRVSEDEDDAPLAVDYLNSLFCDREGIHDAGTREKIASVFQWVEDCVGGAAEGGRFKDLPERLKETRDFALRTGKYRRARGAAAPASVVRSRAVFLAFLDALRAKLTGTFGAPEAAPIPAGYV